MKKQVFILFSALLFNQVAFAYEDFYDFFAVSPSGDTLYYIIRETTVPTVSVTAPQGEVFNVNYIHFRWGEHTKPTGNLIIPDSVIHNGVVYIVCEIYPYAFANCSELTSVTIPNHISIIYEAAFRNCGELTSVTFNAEQCFTVGWTQDGQGLEGVFRGCYITSFTFGSNVSYISKYLLLDATSGLTSIQFKSQMPPQYAEDAFYGIPSNIPVYIPCGRLAYYVYQMPEFSNFEEQMYEFSAISADVNTGTVQILTEPSCINLNAVLSAVPADGYRFDHWSTGSTDDPYTLNVTSDIVVTAYFVSNGGGTDGIGEVGTDDICISVSDGRIFVEGITNEEVRVYDITGRTVQNRSLPSGVYIVRVGTLPAQKVVVMQ